MGYAYMASALASFVVLAFAYRWADARKAKRLVMASVMGLTIAGCALLYAAARGIDLRQAGTAALLLGCGLGLVQAILIPIFMAAVARGDLSLTWTVLQLSFALASAMVLVYPGERPTPAGVAGLVTAALAVALIGLDTMARPRGHRVARTRKGWAALMAVSFVLNAGCAYCYSLAAHFQGDGSLAHRLGFLLASGTVLAAGTFVLSLLVRRPGSRRASLTIGPVAGLCSFAGGMLLLASLGAGVPGYVLYPAAMGGSSVTVVVLSVLLLRERPGRWGWCGIAAGVVALVLMGLAV